MLNSSSTIHICRLNYRAARRMDKIVLLHTRLVDLPSEDTYLRDVAYYHGVELQSYGTW